MTSLAHPFYLFMFSIGFCVVALAGPQNKGKKKAPKNACAPGLWLSPHEQEVKDLLNALKAKQKVRREESKKELPLNLKIFSDMSNVDLAPPQLVGVWKQKILYFLKGFQLASKDGLIEKSITQDDDVFRSMLIRFTIKLARKNKDYENLFQRFGKLMGSVNDMRTYDLLQIYVELNEAARQWPRAYTRVLAPELATIWHGSAEQFVEKFFDSSESPKPSPQQRVIMRIAEQIYNSHTVMTPEMFLEKALEIVQEKKDPHYTVADLARDFTAQESFIRDIDSVKKLNAIFKSSHEFKKKR